MQGKCHCYLTSRHLRGASCFTGAEDASCECRAPFFRRLGAWPRAFKSHPDYGEPLRCSQVSHSGAPRPASPLSLLLFALSREVPPLATTLSYANQQDLDPVHRLLGPDPSPVFHPQNGLGQDATPGHLSPPASFTRRSGDPPGRIQTHPWGAEGWGREALLQ